MPKIGIVLSGALSKGAYQLGFLKALKEKVNLNDIKVMSGSSIGAVNAYAFSTNNLDIIEDLWLEPDMANMFKMWRKIVFKRLIKKYLKRLLRSSDTLHIPLYVSTLQIFPRFKFRYIKFEDSFEKHWHKVMAGAIGFPILTGTPTFLHGRLYTDGGIVDNIPIKAIENQDLDIMIISHFDPQYKINYQGYGKTIILDVDLSAKTEAGKRSFDFSRKNVTKMIDAGYEYGQEILEKVILDDREESLKNVKEIRAEQQQFKEKTRSLDTWPSRLNRLFTYQRDNPNVRTHIKYYR